MNEKIRMRRVRSGYGIIPPCSGKRLLQLARTVVSYKSLGWYLDPNHRLENRPALLKKGLSTKATPFIAFDVLQTVRLEQILKSLSSDPRTLTFEQEQVLAIVWKYPQFLRGKNRHNLFALKEGRRVIFLQLDWNQRVKKLLHNIVPRYIHYQQTYMYPSYRFRVFVPMN